MPIKSCTLPDGKDGYQWGNSGKCYADRADAEKQAAAAYANGYKGKAEDVIDDIAMLVAKGYYDRMYPPRKKKRKGGSGSGNFNHQGRPGERGGSAGGGAGPEKKAKVIDLVKGPGGYAVVQDEGGITHRLPLGTGIAHEHASVGTEGTLKQYTHNVFFNKTPK